AGNSCLSPVCSLPCILLRIREPPRHTAGSKLSSIWRFSMRTHRVFHLFLGLLFAGSILFAQSDSASISGTLTDPSGAVVVGASVQVVNADTNVSQTTRSNQSGLYLFPNLPPGHYRMSVKHPGFKESVQPSLTLHVQDAVSQNFNMQVGGATESVTVMAEAQAVNLEDASVGAVVE